MKVSIDEFQMEEAMKCVPVVFICASEVVVWRFSDFLVAIITLGYVRKRFDPDKENNEGQ